MAALYSVWRLARVLPLAQPAGAINRARQIDRLQHILHMPTELSLQHFVLHYSWLARSVNTYYAVAHVPALIVFLVWLFVRHRDEYSRWRNSLAILTAFCVVIRFVRVAPPRFLPDLGYIDLATRYGWSVYGPVGTGVSDQFAAMPSIHVGWAALVSFGIVAVSTSRWRWLFMLHLVLTMLVCSHREPLVARRDRRHRAAACRIRDGRWCPPAGEVMANPTLDPDPRRPSTCGCRRDDSVVRRCCQRRASRRRRVQLA